MTAPGPRPAARSPSEDDPDEGTLADLEAEVAHAIEAADASELLRLLVTEVIVVEGAEASSDGTLPLRALEPAPSGGGYRDRPALPLWRALGDSAVSAMLLEVLERAHAPRREDAARELIDHVQRHPEVLARLRDTILRARPHLVRALEVLAPGTARFDLGEIRAVARVLRSSATAEDVVRLAPRLALGLPKLKKRDRDSLSGAVVHLARSSAPHAPAAIEALARAGVPVDREHGTVRPIEAATLAGAFDNVRTLERIGARPPRSRALDGAAPARAGARPVTTTRPTSAVEPSGSTSVAASVTAARAAGSRGKLAAGLFGSLAFASIAAGAVWGGVGIVVAYVAPLHLFVMSQLLEEESVFQPFAEEGWSSVPAHWRRMLPPIVLSSATIACGFLTKLVDPSVLAAATACLVVATFLATRLRPASSGDEAPRRA